MNSCELAAYVSSLACMIAKCSSREEMEMLSAMLISLGETLHMMLVHEENCGRKMVQKGELERAGESD